MFTASSSPPCRVADGKGAAKSMLSPGNGQVSTWSRAPAAGAAGLPSFLAGLGPLGAQFERFLRGALATPVEPVVEDPAAARSPPQARCRQLLGQLFRVREQHRGYVVWNSPVVEIGVRP